MGISENMCKWLHEALEELPAFRFPFEPRGLPSDGIYFFYEEEEFWGHGGRKQRIVRVGTCRAGNFQKRINDHYVLNENKLVVDRNKPAPKDRSIFRKNIGRAILAKNMDAYLEIWDIDFTLLENRRKFQHLRDINKERDLEAEISKILREKFSFRFIAVNEGLKHIGAGSLEAYLIGTISGCSLCKPSVGWLGNYSPKKEIRNSGLWQVQHLGGNNLGKDEVRMLKRLIEETKQIYR